jgi:hypothetical protein
MQIFDTKCNIKLISDMILNETLYFTIVIASQSSFTNLQQISHNLNICLSSLFALSVVLISIHFTVGNELDIISMERVTLRGTRDHSHYIFIVGAPPSVSIYST